MLPVNLSKRGVPSLFAEWPNFETLFANFSDFPTEARSSIGSFAIDVEENPESYIVKANVPGIPKENIDVTMEGGALTISVKHGGEKETREDGQKFVHRERWTGSASRTVSLPYAANTAIEDVEGKLKDGVLTLMLRKRPEKQTRKIAIS